VIVGASLAGAKAAETLRAEGLAVLAGVIATLHAAAAAIAAILIARANDPAELPGVSGTIPG
jgi:hypothetical protein